LDTSGPEIRTGKLEQDDSGHDSVALEVGAAVTLHHGEFRGSTASDIFVDYNGLSKALSVGSLVLFDDGAMVLEVTKVNDKSVECIVKTGGDLRSRVGVHLPLADTTDLPALSDKDRNDIKFGLENADIDFVAASFVQTGDAVREIRDFIETTIANMPSWTGPPPQIISKVETASALRHFDDILKESDGIMVARGDLGVDIPLTHVCTVQKELVDACTAVGKPVIVATQMMESISKKMQPTRAEVADVTNAVFDGADCVMLSGESAKGIDPANAVRTMNEIVTAAESVEVLPSISLPEPALSPVGMAAARFAESSRAAAVVVASCPDITKGIASQRPGVPILPVMSDNKIARQLTLFKGVHPVMVDTESTDSTIKDAVSSGLIKSGDSVVFVRGTVASPTISMERVP